MVKIRFNIPDETIREVHEMLRERDTASKSNVLRHAISEALFFEDAEKAGKHFFIGSDTRPEMTQIVGLRGPGPLLDLHAKRAKEWEESIEQKKREQARRGAAARHEKSPYASIKVAVMAEYAAHAAELKPDGQPLYKNQQAFILTMMDRHPKVTDEQTIRGWIKKSPIVVPHWKSRARKTSI
jgi:hypothetical protein